MPRPSKKKKFIIEAFFTGALVFITFAFSIASSFFLSIFIFGRIYQIFDILYYAVLLILGFIVLFGIIKRKPGYSWFMFSVETSLIVFFLSYFILNSINASDFPSAFFDYNIENLNSTFNVFDYENHPFALRGDQICFNITYKSNYSNTTVVTLGTKIDFPNGTVGSIAYTGNNIIVNPNEVIPKQWLCEKFTEIGLNKFYLFSKIQIIGGSTKNDILVATTFIFVHSETEYLDLINRKNLILVFALATIPIILSSIKTLKDLYKD